MKTMQAPQQVEIGRTEQQPLALMLEPKAIQPKYPKEVDGKPKSAGLRRKHSQYLLKPSTSSDYRETI
jgi:hypothetical protein